MQQSNLIKKSSEAGDNLESNIYKMMYSLGIPPLLKGYNYINNATLMILEDSGSINRLNDEVYPKIAVQFHTTSQRVEKAIRHAIEISWAWEGNKSLKNYYTDNMLMPTNSEFLSFISDQIKIGTN